MHRRSAPPPRDSWQSAVEEAEDLRHADAHEHYRALDEVCALAFAILATRADSQRVLNSQEPLPPESLALLARLRRQPLTRRGESARPPSKPHDPGRP